MRGKTENEARSELEQAGLPAAQLESILPHKVFAYVIAPLTTPPHPSV